jgi:hypothetical protein
MIYLVGFKQNYFNALFDYLYCLMSLSLNGNYQIFKFFITIFILKFLRRGNFECMNGLIFTIEINFSSIKFFNLIHTVKY